jgi:hypothetical protein
MKKILLFMILTLTFQAYAGPKISESSNAGFLYGFLTTIENAKNAGDGVLIVSADVNCSKHLKSDQYFCMSDVGGITGDIAKLVYESFSKNTEETFDLAIVRRGTVTCLSVEESNKLPRFNCY